jgi:hypothetical protein
MYAEIFKTGGIVLLVMSNYCVEFEDDSKHLMSYACTATIDDVSWAIRFNMNNVIESNESVYRTIDYRSVVVTKRLKSY